MTDDTARPDGRPADDGAPDPRERTGTLGVGSDGHWQIRFERRLRHSVERVWSALSDPAQQAQWVPGVTIHAVAGGTVDFDFGDEGRAQGEVLAVDPPHRIEHTWTWPGEPDSVVRWELTPDGDGSLMVLLHRPLRREPATDYCTGWHVMLDSLADHLDGTRPEAEPDFAALYTLYSAAGG
ncbi:SRPBCC family protein [Allonocardiopsis opalescens]|uniref:Uncharacterized protein YndB with AHSA1/START domain n=1 Tax=Allonocardiopsis opalescens TaxID=1144618 RepID=A0A2T0PQD6_9ACTN|nr:SRPBCC family protein [Allonocardiopsis opalescens]PRX90926.1 uncharacterized protein YndB with AHSA1/START domain [Allonocardiopsis opalescens]